MLSRTKHTSCIDLDIRECIPDSTPHLWEFSHRSTLEISALEPRIPLEEERLDENKMYYDVTSIKLL